MLSTLTLLAASALAAAEPNSRFASIEQELPGIGLIASTEKVLFVYLPGAIEARDVANGTRRWKAEVSGRLLVATPDLVYIWINDPDNKKDEFPRSRVIGLDAANGKKVYTSDPFPIAADQKGRLDLSEYSPYWQNNGGCGVIFEKGTLHLGYRLMVSGGPRSGVPVSFGDTHVVSLDTKTGKATPKERENKTKPTGPIGHLRFTLKDGAFEGYWDLKPIQETLDVELKVELKQEAAETERGALHTSWHTTTLVATSKEGKTLWSMVLQPRHQVSLYPEVP